MRPVEEERARRQWLQDDMLLNRGFMKVKEKRCAVKERIKELLCQKKISHYKKTRRIPTEVPTDINVVGRLGRITDQFPTKSKNLKSSEFRRPFLTEFRRNKKVVGSSDEIPTNFFFPTKRCRRTVSGGVKKNGGQGDVVVVGFTSHRFRLEEIGFHFNMRYFEDTVTVGEFG
ncbi:hypothetical protein DY000_02041646 [Brassica cretica]|uniref:Uncharacterized protein n=1 Tax=Brassica cretica TaxID=69181 RepID=A0ABQ7BJB0_BRACR|nr:hypothetical protein DY000_02041646 [Brassica cretica]